MNTEAVCTAWICIHTRNTSTIQRRSRERYRERETKEEIATMQDQWNRENEALVESHQDYIRELTDEYNEKLRREHQLQKSYNTKR